MTLPEGNEAPRWEINKLVDFKKKEEDLKFNEWSAEIHTLAKKMDTSLNDVFEHISLGDGTVVMITLESDRQIKLLIDDSDFGDLGRLRRYYTNHKNEFDGLLNSLREKVDTTIKASMAVIIAISEKAAPDIILRKLDGEKVEDDPVEMLKHIIHKEMKNIKIYSYPSVGINFRIPMGFDEHKGNYQYIVFDYNKQGEQFSLETNELTCYFDKPWGYRKDGPEDPLAYREDLSTMPDSAKDLITTIGQLPIIKEVLTKLMESIKTIASIQVEDYKIQPVK